MVFLWGWLRPLIGRQPCSGSMTGRITAKLESCPVVFNLGGNKYRRVVWINYRYRVVYVRFFGTHRQYDEVDSQTI